MQLLSRSQYLHVNVPPLSSPPRVTNIFDAVSGDGDDDDDDAYGYTL